MEFKANDIITRYNLMSKKYELYIIDEVLKVVDTVYEENKDKSILRVKIYSKSQYGEPMFITEDDVEHKVEIIEREVL